MRWQNSSSCIIWRICARPLRRWLGFCDREGGSFSCEPYPLNPLCYPEILITPGMSWAAERGILNMRSSVISKAMEPAGLRLTAIARHGFFPPFLSNHPWGGRPERLPEQVPSGDRFGPLSCSAGTRDEKSSSNGRALPAPPVSEHSGGDQPEDEAWFLPVMRRVHEGEGLYRDVSYGTGPLAVAFTAPLLSLPGVEILAVKAVVAAAIWPRCSSGCASWRGAPWPGAGKNALPLCRLWIEIGSLGLAFLGTLALTFLPVWLSGGGPKFVDCGALNKTTCLRLSGIPHTEGLGGILRYRRLPGSALIRARPLDRLLLSADRIAQPDALGYPHGYLLRPGRPGGRPYGPSGMGASAGSAVGAGNGTCDRRGSRRSWSRRWNG
jgi:hypothetical protein